MTTHNNHKDEGFSLIELAISIIIIGILVGIAFPVMGMVRKRSADKAASASTMTGLAAAKAAIFDQENWTGISAAAMSAAEPTLNFSPGVSSYSINSRNVAFHTTATELMVAVYSASGACFRAYEVQGSPTKFGKDPVTSSALCTPAAVSSATF
jgi:type IV pilus assembly protein PilA